MSKGGALPRVPLLFILVYRERKSITTDPSLEISNRIASPLGHSRGRTSCTWCLGILESSIIGGADTVVVILFTRKSQPIFDGITSSGPVEVVVLKDAKPVLVTPSDSNFITLVVNVGKIKDVILWHTEDVTDLHNIGLVECSDHRVIVGKFENILNNMS